MTRTNPSGNLLHSIHGGGELEPGSKMMRIGLDHHNPVQALQELTDNEELMSVALHEITHFDSLENKLGHVLGFLGYLSSFSAESIRQLLSAGTPVDSDHLHNYLYFRQQYSLRLNVWRPLLEGLALYVQMSRPCQARDDVIPALETLIHVGVVLTSLDPPAELESGIPRGNAFLDFASKGVLMTGYAAMIKGPFLGGEMLANALEFNTGPEWLPYFLGHAYVRALNDRLTRISKDFECPEVFMKLMLRVLSTSTRRLLETDRQLSDLDAVDRVYNWIELFEQAPPERIREVLNLEQNIDVLWFLRTGKRLSGWEKDPLSIPQSLSRLVPAAWEMFTKLLSTHNFDRIASQLGEDPASFAEEVPSRVTKGLMVGTGSLNFSSNGDCSICGWVPKAFGERHALAIRVEQSTWWLRLTDDELAMLPYSIDVIPQLPPQALTAGTKPIAADLPLKINCYVTRTRYGLSADKIYAADVRYPTCLFEFLHSETLDWSLVAIVGTGEGRTVLDPAPKKTTQGLHSASEKVRESIVNFSLMELENWAKAFDQQGHSDLAEFTRSVGLNQELMLSQQRELWARRILNALLGNSVPNKVKRRIMNERMNAVFENRPEFRNLLGGSYSGPCVLAKTKERWINAMDLINETTISRVGKPVFEIDYETNSVRYLGLWKSPK